MKKISKKLNIVIVIMLVLACLLPLGGDSRTAAASTYEEKTVVVGFFEDDNPGFTSGFSDEERKSGYAYEYIQEMARITGWRYEYVYGSWSDIYDLLMAGKIDMVAGVGYLESRESKVLYSAYPMLNKQYYVYALENCNFDVTNPQELTGKRIGIRANSVQYILFREYMKEENLGCSVVAMKSEEACRKAVEAGEIDAYVSSTTHIHDDLKAYYDIGNADCYIAFAPGREKLREEMNQAQKTIYSQTPYYNYILEEKYFSEYASSTVLTREERNWLRNKGYLTLGITKNDLPLSAVDEKGEATGLIADIIPEMEEFLGLTIHVVAYDNTGLLERAVANGEVDLAFPMFCDSWYSEQGGYLITNALLTDRAVIIYKDEFSQEKMSSVAVGTSSVSNRYLVDMLYPNAEKHIYSSRKEYLGAIISGEVGFTVGSNSVISRFIEENPEFEGLKTAVLSSEIQFGFAVPRDSHELVDIINKMIKNIDDSDVTNAMIKYSVVEKKATFKNYVRENKLTVILSCLVVFFIILVATLIIRDRFLYHKKTIAKQGEKLNATQASLEEALQNEIKAKTNLARALSDQNVIYSELLRMESGGVVALDWNTKKLVTVNEAALHIFGFASEEEALSKNSDDLINVIIEEARAGKEELIRRELAEKGSCVFEAPVLQNGEIKYFLQQSVLRKLANGQNICLISLTDITESKMLEMELQTASRIDALSCVNNRGWGEKLINEAMNSKRGGMFCLLDINKFKLINDNFGHQIGDKAIKTVAATLKESFREEDIVMRLGGDEFAVFAKGIHNKEEGGAVIERFFAKLYEAVIPEMQGKHINVSLGACICDEECQYSFDDIYKMADSQMYKCKEKLESSYIFF